MERLSVAHRNESGTGEHSMLASMDDSASGRQVFPVGTHYGLGRIPNESNQMGEAVAAAALTNTTKRSDRFETNAIKPFTIPPINPTSMSILNNSEWRIALERKIACW